MAVVLTVDVSEVVAQAKQYPLTPHRIDLATARAMNRANDQGYTALTRSLAKSTGIKQSDFSRSRGLSKVRALPKRLTAEVRAKSRWTPLSYFDATQRKKGASARPWAKRRIFRGTFLATMKSGHLGVWQRVSGGAERTRQRTTKFGRRGETITGERLRELWGPSLAVELMRAPNPQTYQATVTAAMQVRLPHELNFELSKKVAKTAGKAATAAAPV
jgi:hypothetical protein